MWKFDLHLGKKIILGIAFLFLLLLFQGIAAYVGNARLVQSAWEHSRSVQFLETVYFLQSNLGEMQADLRGYTITTSKDYLALFQQNRMALKQDQLDLHTRMYTPEQSKAAASLDRLILQFQEHCDKVMAARDKLGFEGARQLVATNEGKILIDRARKILDGMISEEIMVRRGNDIRVATDMVYRQNLVLMSISIGIGILASWFLIRMETDLQEAHQSLEEKIWLKSSLLKIYNRMLMKREWQEMGRQLFAGLVEVLGIRQGTVYRKEVENNRELVLFGDYGLGESNRVKKVKLGEGLVGKCAMDGRRILITRASPDTGGVSSGLGDARQVHVAVVPALFDIHLRGVLEVVSLQPFTENQLVLLDQVGEYLGNMLDRIETNTQIQRLYQTERAQTEGLRAQEEELRVQHEEMRVTNSKLIERTSQLEERTEELRSANQFKSEFMANMSHELRTPLNSLLVLSKILADNREGNLTGKQVGFCRSIHEAGSDLLALIIDLLDMSRVQAGTLKVEPVRVEFTRVRELLLETFRVLAAEKQLGLEVELSPDLPPAMETDLSRLMQILKHLVGNALKFTKTGGVKVNIRLANSGWSPRCKTLYRAGQAISFAITDTGIGIPEEKLKQIFEMFAQGDMGTTRRYGGVGLGLTISQELAWLLGGDIQVESRENEGSVFTLYVPLQYLGGNSNSADKGARNHGKSVLVVEDNEVDRKAIVKALGSFKMDTIEAETGLRALELLKTTPVDGITLDLCLPDISGYEVLNKIRRDAELKMVPVIVHTYGNLIREELPRLVGAVQGIVPKGPGSEDYLAEEVKTVLGNGRSTSVQVFGGGE